MLQSGVHNGRFDATLTVMLPAEINAISAGQHAFSWSVLVTRRHTVDRHHLEASLRPSTGWTGLLQAHRSLVEVLARAAPKRRHGHIMLAVARGSQKRTFHCMVVMHEDAASLRGADPVAADWARGRAIER
jgi:hypothetical protein